MFDHDYAVEMLEFIRKSPSVFHAVANFEEMARANGFRKLDERERFSLERGGKYYIKRGGGSIIAFRIPERKISSYSIISAHTDSPSFKLKRNAEMSSACCTTTLNVEGYGGMVINTWFDRPLSIAGRMFYLENGDVKEMLVDFCRDLVLIPSLAIHQNREVNNGYAYHIQKDVRPLLSDGESAGILALLSELAGISEASILDYDLYLYNRMDYSIWGEHSEFISSPRLDDLECAYFAFRSLIEMEKEGTTLPLVALFDNEEVGSSSFRGALSDFLRNTLDRIAFSLGWDREEEMMAEASSLIVSADNAHACHPNYPEKSDCTNKTALNGGVVIKYSANQKYSTDSYTGSLIRHFMDSRGIRNQLFFNNSDIPGGSTLGNLSIQKVSIPTVDVGLAQLAMHSCYESAGRYDVDELFRFFGEFLSR